MPTKQEIATFLLSEGYLLTALEFHQELLEDGTEIEPLKKQFGTLPPQNPELYSSFDLSTVKIPDSVEAALKEKDDRLTLLEYELRMAKQNVAQLREKLTKAQTGMLKAGAGGANPSQSNIRLIGSRGEVVNTLEKEGMKDYETRAINYLVMKYLLSQGYKVSAITFEEEVTDHVVSDWDQVGLNIPPPPLLSTFYRYFYSVDPATQPPPPVHTTESTGGSVDNTVVANLKEEISQYQKRIAREEDKNAQLKKKFDKLLMDKQNLESKLSTLEESIKSSKSQDITESKSSEQQQQHHAQRKHKPRKTYEEVDPNPFNIIEENDNYIRITQELKSMATDKDSQNLVNIVGDALPYIVPGVILKKREELIPVIITAISQHPDTGTRYSLTQILFNLIKRPNEYERKILVDGFQTLAKMIGEERTERELLPQCWEQIHDEHDERRVLVADSCGAITKFVRAELRPSLILSILQQLAQDRSHFVRQAVARNLGVLVSFFETADKYNQVEELLFELLNDPEDDVRATAQRVLLPIFADWADDENNLCHKLMNKFLNEIDTSFPSADEHRLILLLNSFKLLIPKIKQSIVYSAPVDTTTTTQTMEQQKQQLIQQHFEQQQTPENTWNEIDWLLNVCVPRFVLYTFKIDMGNHRSLHEFISLMNTFASTFDEPFVNGTLNRAFQQYIEKDQRAKVLPIYLTTVIALRKKKEFTTYLKQVILNISLEENGWKRSHLNGLQDSIKLLCKHSDKKEDVLNLLWDLVVHPANHVRSSVVSLFDSLVIILSTDEVTKRILPALITLGSDPDQSVRVVSVQALGVVANNVEEPAVLDKIKMQLETFIEEDSNVTRTTITKVFTNMIPHVTSQFRDHFILPGLVKVADRNSKNPDTNQRTQLAQTLFDAFRAYHGCLTDEEAIRDQLLPGLRLIQKESEHMDAAHKSMIITLISEMEATIKSNEDTKAPAQTGNLPHPTHSTSTSGINMASTTAAATAKTKAIFDKVRSSLHTATTSTTPAQSTSTANVTTTKPVTSTTTTPTTTTAPAATKPATQPTAPPKK